MELKGTTYSIERREGESALAHHKRLVYGKLVDKTLEDYDYSELSPFIFGKNYASDNARKMMYGCRATLDIIEGEMNSPPNDDTQARTDELKKEQQRFYDQRREYNKLVTEQARWEHLTETLSNSIESLNDSFLPIIYSDEECISSIGYGDNYHGKSAVLFFSDWHYGMVTDNIWNTYNQDVFKNRLKSIVNGAIDRIQLHQCDSLDVVVIGDLIHGGIHTSARVASNELVCDQIIHASEHLAEAILTLSKYVSTTRVHCTYGNHARTIQNKKNSIHADNLERLIPWWLKQRFKSSDAIHVIEGDTYEFVHFYVRNTAICAIHGDLDTPKNSPRLLSALFMKRYNDKVDIIVQGDKHHSEAFDDIGVNSLMAGSLCGSDDYANDRRLYSNPEQLMLIIDKDGLDAIYKLRC